MSAADISPAAPLCLVPMNSPGPRSSRSFSAILNPSLVLTKVFNLSLAVLELDSESRKQKLSPPPLPTRPRSWCSCANPNLSADSIAIMQAFGTSTPTSITVVDTSRSISPRLNASITASFSEFFILPCISAVLTERFLLSSSNTDSAERTETSSSLSSIIGHTTYACIPFFFISPSI